MVDVKDRTVELVSERPEMEDAFYELLRADEGGTWTFHDIDIDSGTFGEIVSHDLVEEQEDSYELVNPEAVRVALGEQEEAETESSSTKDSGFSLLDALSEWRISREKFHSVGALFAVLGFLFGLRVVFMYPTVFRDAHLVLPGNDPYHYMNTVAQLINGPLSAWNPGDLAQVDQVNGTNDVLMIVTLWWLIAPFGEGMVDTVIVWYPVLAGVISGYLVYRLTDLITGDTRLALTSVILLAITPAHAFRTALGFADHHAFDYIWIAGTALALASLVAYINESEYSGLAWLHDWQTWRRIVGLGIGTAGIVLSWRGGPLFLLPIGLYVWLQTKQQLTNGTDPLYQNLPVVIGVGLGGVIAAIPHFAWGWIQFYRWFAPLLLASAAFTVCSISLLISKHDRSIAKTIGGEVVLVTGLLIGSFVLLPSIASRFDRFLSYLQRTGQSQIAETYSIVSSDLGLFVGPVLLLGLPFVVGLAILTWSSWSSTTRRRPEWLVVISFGWGFILLSIVQNRFAGGLALFISIFSAIGFFHLAAWVDVVPTSPVSTLSSPSEEFQFSFQDGARLRYLLALFVLVGGLSLVLTPVKQSQIAFNDQQYATATFLEQYSDDHEMTYPENNVFSNWGEYYRYNTIVNGEAEHYSLSWRNYEDFITSNDSEAWYERLNGRAGFVVIEHHSENASSGTMLAHLGDRWGNHNGTLDTVSHYRAVYATEDGDIKVYRLVPGAQLVGSGPANESFTAQTDVTVNGHSFKYKKRIKTNETGHFRATVPYPGEYLVLDETITVSHSAVMNGSKVATIS